MTRSAGKFVAAIAVGSLFLGAPACSDEDGDGATTDEEIQDLNEAGEDVENEVNQEIEGQDQGSNEDGE